MPFQASTLKTNNDLSPHNKCISFKWLMTSRTLDNKKIWSFEVVGPLHLNFSECWEIRFTLSEAICYCVLLSIFFKFSRKISFQNVFTTYRRDRGEVIACFPPIIAAYIHVKDDLNLIKLIVRDFSIEIIKYYKSSNLHFWLK